MCVPDFFGQLIFFYDLLMLKFTGNAGAAGLEMFKGTGGLAITLGSLSPDSPGISFTIVDDGTKKSGPLHRTPH